MAALRSSSSSTTFALGKLLQRHLDHAHGAGDDLLPGGDNRLGLLAAEHDGGDFLRVREMHDTRFHHLDARAREAPLELGGRSAVTLSPPPRSVVSSAPSMWS